LAGVRAWRPRAGRRPCSSTGFGQGHLAGQAQLKSAALASFRLASFDLRGHGASEKPRARADLDGDRVWAEDLAAVISGADPKRLALTARSMGARVARDCLRSFGPRPIAGINLVGAASRFAGTGPVAPGPAPGSHLASDDATLRRFIMARAPHRCNVEIAGLVTAATGEHGGETQH